MKRSRRWYLIAGGVIVTGLVLVALFAAQITSVSPDYWDAKPSILDGTPPFPPGPGHLLGTDDYGRDVWSRVVYGTRWSLFFASLVMVARMLIAVPAAVVCAYGPRRVGWLVDKLYVMTSALPPLLIYMLLLSHQSLRTIGLWPSVVLTVTLLSLVEWPRVAVVLKGRLNQLSTEPFVEGAVAAGGTRWQIFRTHLFPHIWPTLLHLMASEMARALLIIAQLGFFGILTGGGVLVMTTVQSHERWTISTGIPEWSTLLSDGRYYILSRPWIPFPPAIAFLTAVTGFTMLSQGLEEFNLSVTRMKELTTGRFTARWRWALLAVPIAAVLWYCQGLPWDRVDGLQQLADRQAAALTAGNLDGYAGTHVPEHPGARSDARKVAAALTASPVESAGAELSYIFLRGAHADAMLTLTVNYRDQPSKSSREPVSFVRRWGTWYVDDVKFRDLRGYHVDVSGVFDPLDPTIQAAPVRQRIYYLATSADHAFAAVSPMFPGTVQQIRPQLRFYPDDYAFRQVVGAAVDPDENAWYAPGGPIRISPGYLQGYKKWETERTLGYEMIKYLTYAGLHQETVDPVSLGAYELTTSAPRAYEPEYQHLAGTPLLSLEELFATRLESLTPKRQWVFAAESAVLVQYLKDRLPESELHGPAPGKAWSLTTLAQRLGQEPADLSAAYGEFLDQQLAATSLWNLPEARQRIPADLVDAITARAKAAATDDGASFRALTDPSHRDEWDTWLAAARRAGLSQYEASLLEWDPATGRAWVLERLRLGDGRTVTGVVIQGWSRVDETWAAGPVASPLPVN
jgi:peptide/nickel transport system permease protein